MMNLRNAALPALLLSAPLALAAPIQLNHSGFLLDENDQRVNQPALEVTFELFDARLEGNSTFSATCTVNVAHGYYSVTLGSPDCGPSLDSSHLPGGEARYLSITIGTHTLSPRLAVLPYPNAVEAANAARLAGVAASEYALKSDLDALETDLRSDLDALETDLTAAIATVEPEGFARLDGATFTGEVAFEKAVTLPAPTAGAHAATRAFVESHTESFAYSKAQTDALLESRDADIASLEADLTKSLGQVSTKVASNESSISTLTSRLATLESLVGTLGTRVQQLEARLADESATGAMKLWFGASAPPGWVLLNGNTIGAPNSGATRANADTQDLFVYLWTTFGTSIELRESNGNPTGRGSSALADYNARKRLVLFNARGLVPRVAGSQTLTSGTKSGPSLRSKQDDALQNFTGYFELTDNNTTDMRVRVASTSGVFSTSSASKAFVNSNGVPGNVSAGYRVNFNASNVARTASETRVASFGVNIIMKL